MDFDFFESQAYCSLCDTEIEVIEYDLALTKTSHSKLSINLLLQGIVNDVNLQTSEICKACYLLLDELDSLKSRTQAIEDQLKNYLVKVPKIEPESKTEVSENYAIDCSKESNCFKAHIKINHTELNSASSELVDIAIAELGLVDLNNSIEDNEKHKKEILATSRLDENLSNSKPINCTDCPKSFNTTTKLKSHIKTHNNEKPYICEICGKIYKKQQALKIHVDMHNGINPFTCAHCNKSFTQKGALVRHMPQHTGEMPFQCDLCGKRFIHHTSFKIHKISHTGQKSYKCDVCGLLLMSGSHLKRHMRVHTGEKKYSCSICGKKFAEKYNLAVHEKVHSGNHKPKRTDLSENCRISC